MARGLALASPFLFWRKKRSEKLCLPCFTYRASNELTGSLACT